MSKNDLFNTPTATPDVSTKYYLSVQDSAIMDFFLNPLI